MMEARAEKVIGLLEGALKKYHWQCTSEKIAYRDAEKAIEALDEWRRQHLPTRAKLLTGLRAAIAALEYAETQGYFVSVSAAAEIWAHVNGYEGSPDIRELVKQNPPARQG